jgi:pimeloyl-ACP methyl ester carboxylesterase
MPSRFTSFSIMAFVAAGMLAATGAQTVNAASDTASEAAQTELTEQAAGFISSVLSPKQNSPRPSTPADFGMAAEDVEFQTSDGVTLRGWLIRGSMAKVAIQSHFVLANRSGAPEGRGGEEANLSKTAKAFHDAGYTVLMFDARNHGVSDKGPISFALGTQQDSRDYVAAVDFITGLSGYENASIGVMGMCFGASALPGAFALDDGLSSRDNVKAITIVQPGTWGQLMRGVLGDTMVDEINRQLVAAGSDDMDLDSNPNTASINVPVMLMHNQNDPLGSQAYTQDYFDAIPTEKTLHWIDGPADRGYAYRHITKHPEPLVQWFDQHLN